MDEIEKPMPSEEQLPLPTELPAQEEAPVPTAVPEPIKLEESDEQEAVKVYQDFMDKIEEYRLQGIPRDEIIGKSLMWGVIDVVNDKVRDDVAALIVGMLVIHLAPHFQKSTEAIAE